MQIFPRKVLFHFQTSLEVPLCLGVGAVWKCQSLFFPSLCPAEPNKPDSGSLWTTFSSLIWRDLGRWNLYRYVLSRGNDCLGTKPPFQLQTGYSDRLRRRQEGNVPSQSPFRTFQACGAVSALRERWQSHPASQAGLQTMTNPSSR